MLVAHTPVSLRPLIAGTNDYEQTAYLKPADGPRALLVSPGTLPEFLARLRGATEADP